MISPLTLEPEWDAVLAVLPVWEPLAERLVVVSPHPDDETLGCGGLIAQQAAKGVEVVVVAVTDGEAAYAGEPGQAATRRVEQELALARLGVTGDKLHRLGLPDSAVASHEAQLAEQLLVLLTQETLVVAPWTGDYHPDHEACGRAAKLACDEAGASVASYFFWTWHRGTPGDLAGHTLRRLPLDPNHVRTKEEALRFHASQLAHPSGAPILPENLLGPLARPYEVFLLS